MYLYTPSCSVIETMVERTAVGGTVVMIPGWYLISSGNNQQYTSYEKSHETSHTTASCHHDLIKHYTMAECQYVNLKHQENCQSCYDCLSSFK